MANREAKEAARRLRESQNPGAKESRNELGEQRENPSEAPQGERPESGSRKRQDEPEMWRPMESHVDRGPQGGRQPDAPGGTNPDRAPSESHRNRDAERSTPSRQGPTAGGGQAQPKPSPERRNPNAGSNESGERRR
jgi:hypothetical protein